MSKVHGDSRSRRERGGITVQELNAGFYGPKRLDSQVTVSEAMRQMYAHQLSQADQPPRLHIGRGATVSLAEAEARSRMIFLKALYGLVPETTALLICSDSMKVERAFQSAYDEALAAAASDPTLATLPNSLDLLASISTTLMAAIAAKSGVVEDWQGRFQLSDEWLANMAWRTMGTALKMQELGLKYRGPLNLGTLSWTELDNADHTTASARVVVECNTPVYPVYLDDLKLDPDEAGFDMYGPRKESVRQAEARIIEALRPRLRRALESIAAIDGQENATVEPIAFRKSTAFEWLVRFQVLGESRAAIAKADAVDRAGVTRAVNDTARLIGLTLRMEKGGRPSTKSKIPVT